MLSKQSLCWRAFGLCFFQYVFTHCCRQTWSVVSGKILYDGLVFGFTSSFLGWINFSFLFSYGLSVLLLGRLGDLVDTKIFLLSGQFLTGIIFGLIGLLYIYEQNHRYLILFLMILNGVAQSTGWPSVVTIVDNWFPQHKKLILMGYFAACANVGNIFGDILTGVTTGTQNQKVFVPIIFASIFITSMSFMNLIFLDTKPDQTDSPIQTKQLNVQSKSDDEQLMKPLTYFTVWLVPGVALYAIAFGFVKSVYYNVGFWLPDYLDQQEISHNTYIIAMLDVGSIPGGIIVCYIGYYTHKRASVIVPSLLIGTIIMIMTNYIQDIPNPFLFYIIFVFFMGAFIGGVYNNIVGGIVVELGGQFKNNKKAVASIAAVIEGYGSMFAALNQLIVGQIPNFLFLYCGLLCLLTAICLIPYLKNELFSVKQSESEAQTLIDQTQELVNKKQIQLNN